MSPMSGSPFKASGNFDKDFAAIKNANNVDLDIPTRSGNNAYRVHSLNNNVVVSGIKSTESVIGVGLWGLDIDTWESSV